MIFRHRLSAATLAVLIGAGPGLAGEMAVYPYATKYNYCPQGLKPVVVGGVICCGTPNQHISYQAAMSPPRAHKPRRAAADTCPAGVKGCR